MLKLTRKQRTALLRVYRRHVTDYSDLTYREFRRQLKPVLADNAVIIQVPSGMWIGIEPDGHTHT